MRLSEFILKEMEKILVEWEAFAKTLYPVKTQMTPAGLRDHAEEILKTVAADLATEQTTKQQSEKSKGLVDQPEGAPDTAAQTHATLRAQSGMDIIQLAAEYRALRASVLRLWRDSGLAGVDALQDVIRFNEAIDQALAESVGFFSEQVDQARNLLLGMLGHDMRSPLNAIVLTSDHLASLNAGEEISEAAMCLIRSGSSMKSLLDDLVDFNRTKLGVGINIEVASVDLGRVCTDEVSVHRAAHPGCLVELNLQGNLQGLWDGTRLQQLLRNLLTNASAHGTPGKAVRVSAQGDESAVRLEVWSEGAAIEPGLAHGIFDPLRRGNLSGHSSNRNGMGLGLYIVREITRAHGGEVELRSEGGGNIFSVCLPRRTECQPRQGAGGWARRQEAGSQEGDAPLSVASAEDIQTRP